MPGELFSKKLLTIYFQKIWMQTNSRAINRETIVFVVKGSPIMIYVNRENATIPVANPKNLPGHTAPP